jgi:hypothetical protein
LKAAFLFGGDFVFAPFPYLVPPRIKVRGAAISDLQLITIEIAHARQVHHPANVSFPIPEKFRAPFARDFRMAVAAESAGIFYAAITATHAGPCFPRCAR